MSEPASTAHEDGLWMARALERARGCAAFASPNPAVGCVLVRGGEELAGGAHRYDERDHAEIVALKNAAARGFGAHGATAYVTLEPCTHHGRTGPCADALVTAGVTRCVVATVDPNPLVRGAGIAKMRAAGVEVQVLAPDCELAQAARRLNDAFAFAIQSGRPFLTLKAALSVDGMLAPAPSSRFEVAPVWLTGEAARADVQRLRHANDAIMTGIGTVLADAPGLTDRTGLGRRRPLLRVVVDAALRMPLDAPMVKDAANDVLVCCGEDASNAREDALLARGVDVFRLPAPQGRVDLQAVMQRLAEQDVRSVLAEAGSTLNAELLRAGLVDKVVLYYAPTELGPEALPFAAGAGSPYALQERLTGVERAVFAHGLEEDVRVSGYVRDPWDGV